MYKETGKDIMAATGRETATDTFPYLPFRNRGSVRFHFLWFLGAAFLLLALHTSAYGGSLLSGAEKKELYSQGTEFFHQATEMSKSDPGAARDLYQKALLRFERLVEDGEVRNGKLYYNIGNIYFLLDDIGRAILNYRRAEHYIPNDPNLAKNLAYARSLRPDKLETQNEEKILKTLFFFHYDLRARTRLILFGTAWVFLWLFGGMKIFTKRPFSSWGLGVALVFVILFGTSLMVESRESMIQQEGVILSPEVVGRQGDAQSYQPSFEAPLHAGTEFMLLENRGEWWRIELPDGRSSWIPSHSAELVGKG
jgi:hypothetical protein